MTVEIENNVSKFTRKVYSASDNELYKAVMKAGGLVKRDAQRGSPSKKISNSIGVIGKNPKGSGPEANIGVKRGSKGWYGKFFETGAKGHEIKPKNGKVLAFTQSSGSAEFANSRGTLKKLKYFRTKSGYTLDANEAKIYFKRVDHPGIASRPFLRPAFDRNKTEIIKTVGDAIRRITVQGGTLID